MRVFLFCFGFSLKFLQNCSSHETRVCVCMCLHKGGLSQQRSVNQGFWKPWSFFQMTNSVYNLLYKRQFIANFFKLKKIHLHFLQTEKYVWGLRIKCLFILVLHCFESIPHFPW